ncbi:hypothetical protein BOVAC2_4358 [Bacteroides ovatus]|nr:hypothetical protein BOVAC2_4358 [Bacteroides ovatus]
MTASRYKRHPHIYGIVPSMCERLKRMEARTSGPPAAKLTNFGRYQKLPFA